MSTRPLHVTQLAAVVAGALLLLSACAGSSSSASDPVSAPAAAATSSTAGGGDMAAYRDCMAANGVTLPEGGVRPSGAPSARPSGPRPSGGPAGGGGFPGGLPDGVDQATFDAARAACASLQPQGGGFGGQRGGPQMDATATAAFKSCLTDHAVTVPDGDNWMAQLDRSDPTVQSAMDTCAPLLPKASSDPSAAATPAP